MALRLLSEVAVSSRDFPNKWQQLRGLSRRRPVHPAIAEVHALSEFGPQRYVVTALVRAESLADGLRRQARLTARVAVHIAVHVAEALEWAHCTGTVHGGIKPANVFVGDLEVKVTDFAINQGLFADHPDLDPSGEFAWCSPEQLAGLGAGPASDIYSLGILLYQMLCGEPPFRGDSPQDVARRHIRDRAPSLSGLGLEVPEHILRACELCLAKDPGVRPSAGKFASLLRDAGAGEVDAESDALETLGTESTWAQLTAESVLAGELPAGTAGETSTRPRSWPRRSPVLRAIALATMGTLILSAIIAAALLASGGGRIEQSPAPPSRPNVSANAGPEGSQSGGHVSFESEETAP